jgi:hypothetical protein
VPYSIDPTVGFSAVRRRYTLTQWFVFTWVIAGFISLLIGSTISFIPTHLVELVLIVLGLAIGIVFLVLVTPSQDSPEWNLGEWDQEMKTLPSFLRRPAFYFVGTIMVAFLSAPNLYMVVLATHAATSRSVEITLSVSGTNRGLGVLGGCSHSVTFMERTSLFMRDTCISPEDYQIVHHGSRLQVSGSQSLMGFRPTSLRQCTPPVNCQQTDVGDDSTIQAFLNILFVVMVVGVVYIGWQGAPPNVRLYQMALPILVAIVIAVGLHLVCQSFQVLCLVKALQSMW